MVSGLAVKKMPVEIVLICATVIVCVGIGLLGSLPAYPHLWPGLYGYEIITGLALGLASPPYFVLVATSIQEKDIAVGTGALNMVRTLGGCVAVAICTAIHREHLNRELAAFLSREELSEMQSSTSMVARLPDAVRDRVGVVFGGSFSGNVSLHWTECDRYNYLGNGKKATIFMEAKDGQSKAAASEVPAQETDGKQPPEVVMMCRRDDNASPETQ
ncbi:hypothetical protein G6011_01528 [Alternaria panax]|uniref:Uncharacterized protein n=1 Tax=Alternaria panax TaxID=48097 RepID=A0AAD4IK54_9PLEO|nr:hypothetical protein G6011_01528 [Alternaria panax]